MTIFDCKTCSFTTTRKSKYNIHLTTNKHKEKVQDASVCSECKFICRECNYETNNETNYMNHKNTKTHRTRSNDMSLSCQCGERFYTSKSMTYHKKRKCTYVEPEPEPEPEPVHSEIANGLMRLAEQQELMTKQIGELGTKLIGSCCCSGCKSPSNPVAVKYRKVKETEVASRISIAFPERKWVSDKRIAGGCSRRRPDLLLDLRSHVIIVEVDENCHAAYDSACEIRRTEEISADLGGRPIVFIRFNPDQYKQAGVRVPSPWRTVDGATTVCCHEDWEYRISTLICEIHRTIRAPVSETRTVRLFYGGGEYSPPGPLAGLLVS